MGIKINREQKTIMNVFGSFIRTRRRQVGLTQAQVAQKAGVGLRVVRDLEQGKPRTFRTDTLNRILKLFGKCLGIVDLKFD